MMLCVHRRRTWSRSSPSSEKEAWAMRAFICISGAIATWLVACDEPGVPERAAAVDATEIEVTAFEDHGVALQLELQSQPCFGGVNLAMSTSATASDHASQVGQRGGAYVWAGSFIRDEWSPQMGLNGHGSGDGGSSAPVAPHVWRISAERLASTRPDEFRFAADIEYLFTARRDIAPTRSTQHSIIALREGEMHVVDMLELPRGPDGCDHSVLVDVQVVREEPVAVRDRRLSYELWHVHTLPDGRELVSRGEVDARHAEQVPFELAEVRPALAQPLMFGDAEHEVAMRPSGSLRGRLREDGAIDLLVEARIKVTTVESGEVAVGGTAVSGRHAFRLEPGQTLRLELPEASSRWSRAHAEHELVVHGHEVLRDHMDALLVRATLDDPSVE
ncbi:MAG: hypothetical protein IAG13_08325 [Deltaproteobacteria bacterium]|nr:hypothetical protein [Nannocystaceae bacterium]